MGMKNLIWLVFMVVAVSCGGSGGDDRVDGSPTGNDGSPGNTNDGGNNPAIDGGDTPGIDGGFSTEPCTPGSTQCNNCIDDDGDGFIDGDDVHCISALDNDESSFATGIPGDNKDPHQDCFFDGDSGHGNDGCRIDTCCLLGTCPDEDCTVSDQCKTVCGAAAPPGCDCFGCCTICDGTNCEDVLIVPDITPGWDCNDLDNLNDPEKCPQCTKIEDCGSPCEGSEQSTDCILCPGQTEDDLPAECNNMNECPDGKPTCEMTADCGSSTAYCSNRCCVDIVID